MTVQTELPTPPKNAVDESAGTLLPIVIEVRGEIVTSNFTDFAEMVRGRLGEINRSLVTDEDFDQADKDAKAIAGAESALKAAKEKALSDAEDLHLLFGQIDGLSGELATARLNLAKQITKRKEEVKGEIIEDALKRFDAIGADYARRVHKASLVEAIKGKRSVSTMKTALNVTMTIHLATIEKNRGKLDTFENAHGTTLTLDRRELEVMSPDSLDGELRRRFDLKKSEDEKKRLAAEADQAKAEAALANEKLAASQSPSTAPAPPTATVASTVQGLSDNPFAPRQPATIGFTDGPSGPGVIEAPTEQQEWEAFEKTFMAAFAPVKAARAALQSARNISRAQVLANSILTAWNNR